MTYETSTISAEESSKLGEKVGRLLKPGDFVELSGDLGGGKTTIVRGMLKGMGYTGTVTSPSFTISRIYYVKDDVEFHHYDFYRLNKEDIVNQQLEEVAGDPHSIVAVEWAANTGDVLPEERLVIRLFWQGETERLVVFAPRGKRYEELVEKLKAKK